MTAKPTPCQTLADIPEFKAAKDRLLELQVKLTGAQERFADVNSKIARYDELVGGPISGHMQKTPGQSGMFAPPPDRGPLTLEGNARDVVGEKARELTTGAGGIDVPQRVSRDKLVEQLEAVRTEMRIFERAIQMQRRIVGEAANKGSQAILKAASPVYKQHVLSYLQALEAVEAAEARMRDYWVRFYDQPDLVGVDAYLPPLISTGLGRLSESQSKINRIFSDAKELGISSDRKVA